VIRERAVVSDEEARRYYDSRPNEYTKEYRVSHILVSTLEDADKVATLLQKQSFSWVARRNSIDRHTGPGGDLGFLSKGNMIPEFEQIVFNMKTGDVSDVIESDFGYHFVKVTEIRNARNKLDYDDVAEDISRNLLLEKRSAVYDSLVHALRDNAQIELLDPEMRILASEADSSR
jgi:peptidyl-prolyl cis-trans isomerase C